MLSQARVVLCQGDLPAGLSAGGAGQEAEVHHHRHHGLQAPVLHDQGGQYYTKLGALAFILMFHRLN